MMVIKESVDRDTRPGRFLLTGSANVMALPTVGIRSLGASRSSACSRCHKPRLPVRRAG